MTLDINKIESDLNNDPYIDKNCMFHECINTFIKLYTKDKEIAEHLTLPDIIIIMYDIYKNWQNTFFNCFASPSSEHLDYGYDEYNI